MFAYFFQGLLLGFPAAAQPGPFQAYLLSQVTQQGWRRTLPAALAPLLSDGPIILLVLLVLTQLPPSVLSLIQVVGGLFILYLARGAWRNFVQMGGNPATTAKEEEATVAPPRKQSIWEAALMNFLNPNPFLFWGTVGGIILLEAWAQSVWHAAAFLLGLYGTLIGGFAFFILLFGTVGQVDARVNRGLSLASAVALLLFGLWQVGTGGMALVQ
jgi:threonine/homoserine/homoserine lactone efflux protein